MAPTPLIFAMLSDPGRVRRRNEDACAADGDHGVFVVCDGVGGAAGGEIASRLAADTFLSHVIEMKLAGLSPEVAMHNGVDQANRIVHRQSSQASLRGMATTLVALYFVAEASGGKRLQAAADEPRTAWLANVGDSRCYQFREGSLTQLTLDHSIVEEQVRAGELTREQADRSPIRNVITRAVGSDSKVIADVKGIDVLTGDIYLLCSDGLIRELSDSQILEVLSRIEAPTVSEDEPPSNAFLEEAVDTLVAAANGKGGGDNITCVLVQIA